MPADLLDSHVVIKSVCISVLSDDKVNYLRPLNCISKMNSGRSLIIPHQIMHLYQTATFLCLCYEIHTQLTIY